jgi:hypothetical protein
VDASFKVLKWIGKNTYKIELPIHLDILGTFNVVDLTPYYSDDSTYDSRTSSFQLGKHNTGISSFNVVDLTPYYSDDSTYDLRTSSFQLGKHNTGISSNGPIDVELFEFGLVMQMNEVLDVVYYRPMGQL